MMKYFNVTGKIPIIAAMLFMFSLIINAQTTYYISSSQGKDSNTGKSSGSPWKTISKLNSINLIAGDKVLFKKGDKWIEGLLIKNSGASGKNIFFGTYGSGNRPIISLRAEVSGWKNSASWSKAQGNNIWKMTFPNFDPGGNTTHRLWLNNVEYPRAKDLYGDNKDNLTPGQSTTHGVNNKHRFVHQRGSKGTLFVWTDGSNPASYYNTMEYTGFYTGNYGNSTIFYAIELKNADYITLDNLDIQGGIISSVGMGGSDNVTIQNCNIGKYSNHHGIYADTQRGSDKSSDNLEVYNCTIDTDRKVKVNFYDGLVVYGIAAENASNWKIHHNILKNWNFGFLTRSKYGVSRNHQFYNNEVSAPDIESCKPLQLGADNENYDNSGHSVFNNYFHDFQISILIARPKIKFYFNVIKNVTASQNEHFTQNNSGYGIQVQAGAYDLHIFNNTFYTINNHAIVDWSSGTTYCYNNLFYNAGLSRIHPYQLLISSSNRFQYKNNLLACSKLNSSSKIIWLSNSTYYTVTEFNNIKISGKTAEGNEWAGSLTFQTLSSINLPVVTKTGVSISSLVPSGFKDRFNRLVNLGSPTIGAVTSSSGSSLMAKVFLQAPFETESMTTSLSDSEKLPLSQPYSSSPWNYSGKENVQKIPEGVVDWILLELRKELNSDSEALKRAAFLKEDGSIVDLDGINPVDFPDLVDGSYYLVVKHRNHLGIMSSERIMFNGSKTFFDFTASPDKTYGSDAADLGNGRYGMYAGDEDGNGIINNEDLKGITETIFRSGYKTEDLDLNGVTNVMDYIKPKINMLKYSNIPQ